MSDTWGTISIVVKMKTKEYLVFFDVLILQPIKNVSLERLDYNVGLH